MVKKSQLKFDLIRWNLVSKYCYCEHDTIDWRHEELLDKAEQVQDLNLLSKANGVRKKLKELEKSKLELVSLIENREELLKTL